MLSKVRTRMSALFLILVASGLCVAQRPDGIQAKNQVVIRFKESAAPAANNTLISETASTSPNAVANDSVIQAPPSPATTTTPPRDTVRHVQYEYSEEPGSIAPRYTVAQNPLDDLQQDLQSSDANTDAEDLGGIFNELNEVTAPPPPEASPPVNNMQNQGSPIVDSILGRDFLRESSSKNHVSPEDTNNRSYDEDVSISKNPRSAGAGLRDDAYYLSLGTPKEVRRAPRGDLPLTMGNIFGDDDEYDPACVRRYCDQVWQCAGGRGQNFCSRSWRDVRRSWQLRNGQKCGTNLSRNEFKCRKLSDQDQGFPSPACGSQPGASGSYEMYGMSDDGFIQDGEIVNIGPYDAWTYGIEAREDLSQIEGLQAPTPSVPMP